MGKIFVIAGTRHEAEYWIINDLGKRYPSNTSLSMSDYVYVASPDVIRGHRDPHGVFIGNWLGRPDIFEIVEALMISSVHVNPALGKIYKDLKPKVRPTPKISGLTYNQVIADAAKILSDAIDEHVTAEIAKKMNKGDI